MSIKRGVIALSVGSLVCIAVAGSRGLAVAQHETGHMNGPSITKAVAILLPTKGNNVQGRVTFTEEDHKVRIHAEISGLTPGDHGFHIHEFGVWSEDGMAAGSHYDPTATKHHAGIDTPKRHVGDLGNITANANGNATLDLEVPNLHFHGPTSIIGRGLVVHEKPDDLVSQPAGNAGARVAVGVIGVAKP